MAGTETPLAPGARIVVRNAEWLVRRVDAASSGGHAIGVVGLSEIVRDKEAIFLTELEHRIEVIDPADTRYVLDESQHHRDATLHIESLLRQTPPTDTRLHIGHRAAIDHVPYQLEPALQALRQPRQRILIADAVGLGKTIEAGILLSELIKRGRARRILVLTVKSMLTQFQKELWSRFTIPLVRLDSVGIQRIRARIPTNHNPFHHFDRTIISIDTLKRDAEYRTWLEHSRWDVIVIDEAHNVAERGTTSLRARLARLLASRSDTLIMLSATPHDGKPRAFASIMNMLDPTAIADPDHYTRDDIKGLFIRRFKKDISAQVRHSFRERSIAVAHARASEAEEHAFDVLTQLRFTRLDQRRTGDVLFRTTLEKALLSSPAACLQTIHNRLRTIRRNPDGFEHDVDALEQLAEAVRAIDAQDFAKYRTLLTVITDPEKGFGWAGSDAHDRLVIFTERIESLNFLETHLPADLGLDAAHIRTLHGAMPDVDQDRIVEEFGSAASPVRLLLASDVASEGINLHYFCHRMIHFDIPWSLMVFQQRNGRIDRYGQERDPRIVYLMTDSRNDRMRGDLRILELLIEKDEQAMRNIGDPAALMGVYDILEEERITAQVIETGANVDDFERALAATAVDPMALLLGARPDVGDTAHEQTATMPSLFDDDLAFAREALQYVTRRTPLQYTIDEKDRVLALTLTDDLRHRFRALPAEILPDTGEVLLTDDRARIEQEIRRCRQEERAWPALTLLWEQHPVLHWLTDKILTAFGRMEAPVLALPAVLAPDEIVFLMFGIIPNRRSDPLIQRWFGVRFAGTQPPAIEQFESLVARTGLGRRKHPNRAGAVRLEDLPSLAPEAVAAARAHMGEVWRTFEADINAKLNTQLAELERLRTRKYAELDRRLPETDAMTPLARDRRDRERRDIDTLFDEYLQWIEESMTTENAPYLRIVAVLRGEG